MDVCETVKAELFCRYRNTLFCRKTFFFLEKSPYAMFMLLCIQVVKMEKQRFKKCLLSDTQDHMS